MVGFGMTIPTYCVWLYFPHRRKLFGSINLVFYFMAPIIPNLLIYYATNPDNLRIYFDKPSA